MKTLQRHWSAMATALLALCATTAQPQPQPQPVASQQPKRYASAETVARMPSPKVATGELPRPCADSPRNLKRLEYTSPAVQARWAADPAFLGAMQLWAETHFRIGRSDFLCFDLPFVVRKFQEASGDAPTGPLSERDLDRLDAALTGSATVAGADALSRHDTTVMAVRNLPKPAFGQGELPRPCTLDTKRPVAAQANALRYASEDVRSLMTGFPTATLQDWAKTYFRYPDNACIEWDYVVRKFQAATGSEVTGVIARADLERLNQGLEQGRQLRSDFTAAAADSPRTLVDFLPTGSSDLSQGCAARSVPLKQQARVRTEQRVLALPPAMKRSAVTESVEREVKAELMPVGPQWAEYWASRPALRQWAIQNGCNDDLHFMIEHWQLAIGARVDARDATSIAPTEALLKKAQSEFAVFSETQGKRLAAEAAASGETARARTWSLDEVAAGTRLADLAAKVPTALCTIGAERIDCAGRVDPCAAEKKAAAASGNGPAARQAALERDLSAAALKRCEARSSLSAAANSKLLFAGQELSGAQLTFDSKGLATMQFTMAGAVEPARTLLTRRYGNVDTQQEVRTGTAPVAVAPQPVYVPGGGTVYTAPTTQMVPTSYTVTRYIWATPDVRIEASGGNFMFRFLK